MAPTARTLATLTRFPGHRRMGMTTALDVRHEGRPRDLLHATSPVEFQSKVARRILRLYVGGGSRALMERAQCFRTDLLKNPRAIWRSEHSN